MPSLSMTDRLFFEASDFEKNTVESIVAEVLRRADDGELFLEYSQSETAVLDDSRIRNASFNISQGFGLRLISGEATGYAHSSVLGIDALKRAAESVATVGGGRSGVMALPPERKGLPLYYDVNPLAEVAFDRKITLLEEIDRYARGLDPTVVQVMASLSASWQAVQVIRGDGFRAADIRPLVRLNVTVVARRGDRIENGSYGMGGRDSYEIVLEESAWKGAVNEALRQALVNLESIPAPAGEMPVVLGGGWPGILLHEAVGHGLEGDFNRKKTSAFSGLLGKRVASPGVTVVDDGSLVKRRGSISMDDEGTSSSSNVLIEDGILVGYLQDRLNGRLMGARSTGNGRRENYAHAPLPRMTNTFMLSGDSHPDEIIRSVKNGLYAVNFSGGQVDITSGKFVFSASEAYLIEDGKIGPAVKGATLIGNGPDAMTKVKMVGHDLQLDPGIGTCGKDGQGVPVGVGQPTLLIGSLTVGGTAV